MAISAEDILQTFSARDEISPVLEQIRAAQAAWVQETEQANATLQSAAGGMSGLGTAASETVAPLKESAREAGSLAEMLRELELGANSAKGGLMDMLQTVAGGKLGVLGGVAAAVGIGVGAGLAAAGDEVSQVKLKAAVEAT